MLFRDYIKSKLQELKGIFLDEEVEAENQSEAREIVFNEIMDNLGNYIDIVLERIEEDKGE